MCGVWGVSGLEVSMDAFQAVDPSLSAGTRTAFCHFLVYLAAAVVGID